MVYFDQFMGAARTQKLVETFKHVNHFNRRWDGNMFRPAFGCAQHPKAFLSFFFFSSVSDGKSFIYTSEEHAEHPFVGRNSQHLLNRYQYNGSHFLAWFWRVLNSKAACSIKLSFFDPTGHYAILRGPVISTKGTLDLGTLLGSFLWSFMVH